MNIYNKYKNLPGFISRGSWFPLNEFVSFLHLISLWRVSLPVPVEVADPLTAKRLHGEKGELAVVEAQTVERY